MVREDVIADFEFPINMGEETAFDLAYRTYHQPLRFFSAKFVGDEDAEDVVENLFLKLWHKQQEIKSREHLQAFLYHSIRNACLNHIKVSKNTERRYEIFGQENPDVEESHIKEMIRAEVLAEVYRAINRLPSQCSKVISMSYIDGLSNKEIAEKMELPEQVVKNYKQRGLKILKGNLSGTAMITLMVMPFLK